MRQSVRGFLRSCLRACGRTATGIGGARDLSLSTVTTTAGTDASDTGTNSVTIPAGYNSVAVWAGTFGDDLNIPYISLNVKVGGTTTTTRITNGHFYLVRGSAGDVVSFASQKRINTSLTLSNQSITLKCVPMIRPTALTIPTSVTGTANCDKSGPPVWVPSGTPHIIMTGSGQTFQINAASGRREFFMVELDGTGNQTPVRHIHVPDNQAVTVQMRFSQAYLANYTGATASITAPNNTTIGGTSAEYRPSFTVIRQVDVSTVTALKNALTSGTVADGDDIVLAAGTYDLTSIASAKMIPANFASAMGKSIRIRGATGTASDVVFTAAGWDVNLSSTSVTWIIESVRWSLNGIAAEASGLVDLDGKVYVHKCDVIGKGSGTAPNLSMRTTIGTCTNYVTYSLIQNSIDDGINTNNSGGGTLTTHVIGCTCDGNGDNTSGSANKQILTNHNGANLNAWGCILTDASEPTNRLYVTSDAETSRLHLRFCRCLSSDVTHADGLQMSSYTAGIWFCNFGAIFSGEVYGYVIGSTLTQRASSGSRMLPARQTPYYPVFMGNIVVGSANAGSYEVVDSRQSSEYIGNYLQSQGSSSCLVNGAANPATAQVVHYVGNTCKSASGGLALGINAWANVSGTLYNNIFDSGVSSSGVSIGATGGTFSIYGNLIRRSSNPTNWDTRFASNPWSGLAAQTDADGNVADSNAPGLGSDYVPTTPGNCDDNAQTPPYLGALDMYGRVLYCGGNYPRGAADVPRIRTNALFQPVSWW